MRSTKPISASDIPLQGSDRHSFPKNRHGCFKKRSFQPHMACLMPFHAPKMTVFSIVTAAFFPKHGQWPGRGPGNNRYGDDSGEPPPPGRFTGTGPEPGIPDTPTAIAEIVSNFLTNAKNTSEEEFVMTEIKGCTERKVERRIAEGLEILPVRVQHGVSQ